MMTFTEIVYLAAPFARPAERAFNLQLSELIRNYNYPLFMPQEAWEEISTEGGEEQDERFTEVCMDALSRASLVIAVFYGEEFDSLSAFEVGYAIGRRTNVVAIQHSLDPNLCRVLNDPRLPAPQCCSRVIVVPAEPDKLVDRLIPVMNRFFVPHRLV